MQVFRKLRSYSLGEQSSSSERYKSDMSSHASSSSSSSSPKPDKKKKLSLFDKWTHNNTSKTNLASRETSPVPQNPTQTQTTVQNPNTVLSASPNSVISNVTSRSTRSSPSPPRSNVGNNSTNQQNTTTQGGAPMSTVGQGQNGQSIQNRQLTRLPSILYCPTLGKDGGGYGNETARQSTML